MSVESVALFLFAHLIFTALIVSYHANRIIKAIKGGK